MAEKSKRKSAGDQGSSVSEVDNPDFDFVYKALVAAYQSLDTEGKSVAESGNADSIFGKFFSDENAEFMISSANRGQIGSIENWRSCIAQLRCSAIFGYQACRTRRTFRAWALLVREYLICIREALGTPIANPPSIADRNNYQTLVTALAAAYKPYLTDELASVEFPSGIPDEILAGKDAVTEPVENFCEIFERFLTSDVADALAGPKSAAAKETNAWFCRCWSLCAMCLGCCVARVRNVSELDVCVRNYLRCLGKCFRSLTCGLTGPTGCVSGETDVLSGRVVQPVVGSAYGFSFSHYTIEVTDAAGVILSGVIIYPDGSGNPNTSLSQGNSAIASGTLGWVDLQQCLLAAGIEVFTSTTFTITLHVFAVDGTELSPDCVTSFQLSLAQVYIEQISTCWSVNFTNPDEPLRISDSSTAALATVGGAMAIAGAANIIGCASQAIASYSIWAIPDPSFSFPQPPQLSSITPLPNWTQVANIVYAAQTIAQPFPQPPANFSVDQVRALNELSGTPGPSTLTNTWGVGSECFIFPPHLIICDNVPSLTGFEFQSLTLPMTAAGLQPGTGKFTFLLQVTDSAGNQYYDIQRAWIDNENVVGIITGIGGLPHCADLYTQNSNSVFQTVNINGTAWDQIIDISTPDYTKPTSDNFANYTVTFNKQGATSSPPVLISSASPVPARPLPPGVGTLTPWNLQILDAASNPMGLPADQLLAPGEACTYDVILNVNDSTMVDENHNHAISPYTFPIKIINSPHP